MSQYRIKNRDMKRARLTVGQEAHFVLLETWKARSIWFNSRLWQALTDYTLTLWHTLPISAGAGPNSCHGPKGAPSLRARTKKGISQPPNSKTHWAWLIQHIHNHYMLSKQHSWCRLRSTQQSSQVSSSIHSWYHHEVAYNHNFICHVTFPARFQNTETSLTVIACYYAIVRDPSWRASSARFPIVVGLAFCDAFARQKDAKSAYSNAVILRDETWIKGWKDMKGWDVEIWPSYTQLPSPKPWIREDISWQWSCGFRNSLRTDLRIQLGSIGQSVQSDPGCCHFLTKHCGVRTQQAKQAQKKKKKPSCAVSCISTLSFFDGTCWWLEECGTLRLALMRRGTR